jgi:hypothetical protein
MYSESHNNQSGIAALQPVRIGRRSTRILLYHKLLALAPAEQALSDFPGQCTSRVFARPFTNKLTIFNHQYLAQIKAGEFENQTAYY